MPAGVPQKIIIADSALARAARLAPDSASYALHYADHLFASNPWNLTTALKVQESAIAGAERTNDSVSIALASDAVGLFLWRRYEPLVSRRFEIISLGFGWPDFVTEPFKFQEYIDAATKTWNPPLGDGLYVQTGEYFRRARILLPDSVLPFRHEAMLLASRQRWEELSSLAKSRIAQRPGQMWPWLTMGIAQHRLGNGARAAATLDSGFARMSGSDRDRLMSRARLLPTGQQKWFDTLSAVAKAQLNGVYWNVANPSMLIDGNPVYDEFRTRVAYAELMWTNEQMNVHGADSDRGEILIRWGPPDDESTLGPDPAYLLWLYRGRGLNFWFNITPTYGTANLTQYYRSNMLEPNELKRSAIWSHLPVMRRGVDSLPVQIARFRSSRDSIDVAVYGGIRAGALRFGSPTDTTLLKTGVFAIDGAGRVQTGVVDAMRTGQKDTLALVARSWRTRIPASAAYLRVEALETDALKVARAIRDVAGFTNSGFGSSDLLIGTRNTPPTQTTGARWRDFTVAPITGNAIRVDQPIDLLWEVYEPSLVNGSARYRVSIAVQREERAGLVGVAARLASRLRDAVVQSKPAGRVAVQYEQSSAGDAVRTEYLRLDLGGAKRGRYVLTLELKDLNSNAIVTRTRDIVLVER